MRPWKIWNWALIRDEKKQSMAAVIYAILLLAIPYAIINQIMNKIDWSLFNPSTAIDEAIPFIGASVILYASLYLYYPAAAIVARGDESRMREMIMLYQSMFLVSFGVFILFIIAPVHIDLRSDIPDNHAWSWAYQGFMHQTDAPWNAWPSLHVLQSLLIVLGIQRWYSESKWIKPLWVAWILLVISTMTTKQHYFFDVITGLIGGMLSWKYVVLPAMENAEQEKFMPSNLQSTQVE